MWRRSAFILTLLALATGGAARDPAVLPTCQERIITDDSPLPARSALPSLPEVAFVHDVEDSANAGRRMRRVQLIVGVVVFGCLLIFAFFRSQGRAPYRR